MFATVCYEQNVGKSEQTYWKQNILSANQTTTQGFKFFSLLMFIKTFFLVSNFLVVIYFYTENDYRLRCSNVFKWY